MTTMTVERNFRYAGWSAYVSAAAMILSAILPAAEMGGVFETLGAVSTLRLALSMLPIALVLHRIYRVSKPALSTVVMIVGAAIMLAVAGVEVLRLFGAVGLEATTGVVGIWLLLVGYLSYTTGALPQESAWLSLAAGAGSILVTFGFLVSNPLPLWGAVAGLVFVVAYTIWAIWLGRLLLSGKLTVAGHSPSMRGEIT